MVHNLWHTHAVAAHRCKCVVDRTAQNLNLLNLKCSETKVNQLSKAQTKHYLYRHIVVLRSSTTGFAQHSDTEGVVQQQTVLVLVLQLHNARQRQDATRVSVHACSHHSRFQVQ